MFGWFARLLEFFYGYWPSYGGAIILLTLLVMLLVMPLTLKGTRSMMMMQLVQPELKKLQQQYKDDRQKLNEELLAFYKEHNINPLSGCLPLLIQMPVFIVLYRVIHGLTKTVAGPNGIKWFEPDYISKSSDLYQALYHKTAMKSFGFDLSRSVAELMSDSIGKAIIPMILVVGVAVSSYVQQRQISSRNPSAAQNPQQQMLMKIGPVMITFFSLIVPSGLAIYFLVSNLFRVGQQELISRTIYKTPEAARLRDMQAKQAAERAKKGGPEPKGFFAKLLGDATPQLNERSRGATRGKAAPAKGGGDSSGSGGKPSTGGTARPPSARSNGGGRVTPPGSRSAAARRKKKRK